MHELNNLMVLTLNSWGNSFVEQAEMMHTKFSKFHTYNIHEGEPLKDLLKKRSHVKDNYVKADIRLSETKSKLLKLRDYKKWKLSKEDSSKIHLFENDDNLARAAMLPGETSQVEDKRSLLNYFSNQVAHQVREVCKNNYRDT